MGREIFLADANSFITPYHLYYAFDIAPGFWEQLRQHIHCKNIILLDRVKYEVTKGNDELNQWMQAFNKDCIFSSNTQEIIEKYSTIMESVRTNPCYQPSALQEWADINVADPWLIATASVHNFTVITFETSNQSLSSQKPSKKAKIPDVAADFNVKTNTLFYMLRKLKFILH